MLRKILIPLDGSELSERVLTPVHRLLTAQPVGVITLLRIVPRGGPGDPAWQAAEAELLAARGRLSAAGIPVSIHLEQGDPADRILAAVQELHPDLVAMATHGRSGIARWVRGSVAERVLRHCPVPLLLVTPRTEGTGAPDAAFRRILVALDGSELADRVLPLVEAMALVYGSEVVLLRVEPVLQSGVPSPLLQGQMWDPAAVERSLQPQRERLAAAGVRVSVQAAYGVEAGEVLRFAEDADLVAMTTHGRSGVSRWVFGSVAEQVVRHCNRPLLILRVT